METRIRPLSSPCAFGFAVFGRLTSGPSRICAATTMKMIGSTSTTSTSGVMLMDACSLVGSPSRIGRPSRLDHRRLDLRYFDLKSLELRYFEQAVHELGRRAVHLDVEVLDLAREVVESDHSRDRDEDAQGRRDQGLSDAARNHRHSAGPRSCDAPESVDDSDHGSEQTTERSRGTDRGQEPETLLQLDQRLGHGVPECARDELQRSDRIASPLAHAVVLEDARRDHLRYVGFLVQRYGVDQCLEVSSAEELPEHGLENLR